MPINFAVVIYKFARPFLFYALSLAIYGRNMQRGWIILCVGVRRRV